MICEKILSPIKEQDKVDEMSNKSEFYSFTNKSAFTSPTKQIEVLSSIDSKSDGLETSIDEKNVINQPKNETFLAQDLISTLIIMSEQL